MTDLTVITHDAETFVAYLHSTGARSVADLSELERNALRRQLAYERPHLLSCIDLHQAAPSLVSDIGSSEPAICDHSLELWQYVAQRLDEAADDLFRDEASEPMRRAV